MSMHYTSLSTMVSHAYHEFITVLEEVTVRSVSSETLPDNRRVLMRDQSGLRDQIKDLAKYVPFIVVKDGKGSLSDPAANPMLDGLMRKNMKGEADAGYILQHSLSLSPALLFIFSTARHFKMSLVIICIACDMHLFSPVLG